MTVPVYLDHNATTSLAPGVLDVMTRYLAEDFGNPSSSHLYSHAPRDAVNTARLQLAGLLGAQPEQIVFTGSGSEANTLAINGIVAGRTGQVIIQATEHPAVLETCKALTARGIRVTILPVDEYGLVDPADLAASLSDDTLLVSVMHANNETGTIQPIAELAALTHAAGALFHTDAAQTAGKLPFTVDELGVDLLTVAAHKFGGPKGAGALYLRDNVQVSPVIRGGGQERGLRSGTENVAGIAGLGAAAVFAEKHVAAQQVQCTALRDELHQLLQHAFGRRLHLNGHPYLRLPNTLNVSIDGINGADLLAVCPSVAASTGSACHDGSISSPVLAAMNLSAGRAASAIRFSVGRTTTRDDVTLAAHAIIQAAQHIQAK
ncbi:cysteine desulfurase family protein [Catelliglobosispora koreensis]|uniref:cysteine desulfurase family protein n=1 Tax=Catelliglobosispora koreensis TaxID=129052 RepID=UPI00035E7B0D|nr:cysteine desulfurase family protein [Catelliglobosispora koreensis]